MSKGFHTITVGQLKSRTLCEHALLSLIRTKRRGRFIEHRIELLEQLQVPVQAQVRIKLKISLICQLKGIQDF